MKLAVGRPVPRQGCAFVMTGESLGQSRREQERSRRTPAARKLSQRSREHRAPSCQRKAAKNAGGLSGEGQAVLCVQTAKKRTFSFTQNQPPNTGKVAA